MLHLVAIQVASNGSAKMLSIPLIISNSVGDLLGGGNGAFESSIDNVGGHSISNFSASGVIGGRGSPSASHDIVAGWLRVLGSHPKPESGSESCYTIVDDLIGVSQHSVVAKDGATGRTVVVVPAELHGSSSVVSLSASTRIGAAVLAIWASVGITSSSAGSQLSAVNVTPVVGLASPPSTCLLGGLSKESRQFSLSGGNISSACEFGVITSGTDEIAVGEDRLLVSEGSVSGTSIGIGEESVEIRLLENVCQLARS